MEQLNPAPGLRLAKLRSARALIRYWPECHSPCSKFSVINHYHSCLRSLP